MAASVTCPVCLERFEESPAFALHVADCTTPAGAKPFAAAAAPPSASCPMCHATYTSALAAHEIEFHEEECERVNEWFGPVVPMSEKAARGDGPAAVGRAATGGKRPRDALDKPVGSSAVAAGPIVKLFPAHCALCDSSGRTLLHCAGSCARSFHPLCIEDINLGKNFSAAGVAAPASGSVASSSGASGGGSAAATSSLVSAGGGGVSFATAITRDKKAQKLWVCGECTRGVHACQFCGFLGHEGYEIVRCSLADCGLFFHPACLRAQDANVQSPLVCPRHTCTACHTVETNMAACSSCTECCKSVHLRCRDAAEATATAAASSSRGRGDVLDPNFHVCDAHAPSPLGGSVVSAERKAAQHVGLKMHVRPGDVVLVLEYGNLLLPATAKTTAPLAYNQWGVVQRVENLGDGISPAWWTQLLTVSLFSDNSSISVANQYVLPLSTMRLYASPTHMVRDAIKWHAMSEVNVRHLEQQSTSPTTVLAEAIQAFQARAGVLGLTTADRLTNAGDGFAQWQRFDISTVRTYNDTAAPVYIALNTRGRSKPDLNAAIASENTQQVAPGHREGKSDDDGDVDMEDSSAPSQGQGSARVSTVPASGSAPFHSAAASSSLAVEDTVQEVVARLVEGVESECDRGGLLGGALARAEPSTGSSAVIPVEDVATNMTDAEDDDDEMEAAVELPPLDDSDSEHSFENRLSMDDLLNPLSQESVQSPALAPSPPPPRSGTTTSQAVGNARKPSAATVDVVEKKRSFEQYDANAVDVVELMNQVRPKEATEHASKKPKIAGGDVKPCIAVEFSHLPLHLKKPHSSVFSRAPLLAPPTKQKLAAQIPNVLLRTLERHVQEVVEAEERGDGVGGKRHFNVRPAFYRPSPFLYRGARIGRRVDAISRVLLCQDKRNLKCFVRVVPASITPSTYHKSSRSRSCPFECEEIEGPLKHITIDLLAVSGFASLYKEVHHRIVNALDTRERYTGWHWQSLSDMDLTANGSAKPPRITLSYCVFDGSEHTLAPQELKNVQPPEWLCFCGNVVHLTATVVQH